jgi:hypothetical protein
VGDEEQSCSGAVRPQSFPFFFGVVHQCLRRLMPSSDWK